MFVIHMIKDLSAKCKLYLKRLIERERGGGGREREICATNIKLTLVRKLSIVW